MIGLPAGNATVLCVDDPIGGMAAPAQAALLRRIMQQGGEVVTHTPALVAVFVFAPAALQAALGILRDQAATPALRLALHTGRANHPDAPALQHARTLLRAGHAGQCLLTRTTRDLVRTQMPGDATLVDLGLHRFKGAIGREQIFHLVLGNQAHDFPPLQALEAFAHNLPSNATSFVGREHELVEVGRLLKSNRLLTLTGAGGTGKTRLAFVAAAGMVEHFADGVWVIELAALTDAHQIPPALAGVLGVQTTDQQPLLATLTTFLQSKALLLVLDNCEHLLEPCAAVVQHVLHGCPKVAVLVSSREPLGLDEERVYRVPSLATPATPATLESVRDSAAVRLFVERGRAAQPGWALRGENLAAVVQICQQLDGIPLALELAAARLATESPAVIASNLDDRFRMLTGGSRTALPRQQTLRALIDWSYDLLTRDEQQVLRHLSVFSGGWTLAAATAVCAAPADMPELLQRLVNKSLVLVDEGDTPRYRFLETIRQYARDQLLHHSESATARDRHLTYYVDFVEQAQPYLCTAQQLPWFELLEIEHDNLRAALTWAHGLPSAHPLADAEGQLIGGLWWFWSIRNYLVEGRTLVERTLHRQHSPLNRVRVLTAASQLLVGQEHRARVIAWTEEAYAIASTIGADWYEGFVGIVQAGHLTLDNEFALANKRLHAASDAVQRAGNPWLVGVWRLGLAELALVQGDYAASRRGLEEAFVLAEELGERSLTIRILNGWGRREMGDERPALGLERFRAALRLATELDDRRGMAFAFLGLGTASDAMGDRESALEWYEQALQLLRRRGQLFDVAQVLNMLGDLHRSVGALERAKPLYEESLVVSEQTRLPLLVTVALINLGFLALGNQQVERAASLFGRVAVMCKDAPEQSLLAFCLVGLADVALRRGRLERAGQLLGAAGPLNTRLYLLTPTDFAEYRRICAAVEAAIGAAALEQHHARHADLDDAGRSAIALAGA